MLFFLKNNPGMPDRKPVMMRFHLYSLIISALLIYPGCTGSRKYYKAAEKLEKQGLVNEAAEFYLESLRRKPTNADAQIKLKQTGQKYISSLAHDFFMYSSMEEDERALATFEKMKDFSDNAAMLNVRLEYPQSYEEDYKQIVERYCEKQYQEGEKKFNEKLYAEALKNFDAIRKYKSEYKKMSYYYKEAFCEPIYNKAMTFMEEKKYNDAEKELQKIVKNYPDYRDAAIALEIAGRSQVKYGAMLDLSVGQDKKFSSGAVQELKNELKQHAKVEMVSNALFENIKVNTWNQDLIRSLALASGADYLYLVSFSNYRNIPDGPYRNKSKAWQQLAVRQGDSVFYIYQPVTYYQVKASKKISVNFTQKLIRSQDMNVLFENSRTAEVQDVLEYNELEKSSQVGDINSLFPVNPALTPVQMYAVRSWRKLFEARNQFKTDEEMNKQLRKQISSEAMQILSYLRTP